MRAVAREVGWRHDELAETRTRSVALSLRMAARDRSWGVARRDAASVPLDKPVLGIGVPNDRSRRAKGHQANQSWPWRQVMLAWLLAVFVFLTVIPLLRDHNLQSHGPALTRLVSGAGVIAHPRTPQSNDGDGDDNCSERDFANERC
jgi:hypothetical protein